MSGTLWADATTTALLLAATTDAARRAVIDSRLGDGALTVTVKDGSGAWKATGTFSGASLTADAHALVSAALSGEAGAGGTPISDWTVRIEKDANAWLEFPKSSWAYVGPGATAVIDPAAGLVVDVTLGAAGPAPIGTFYVGSHQHGNANGTDRFSSGTYSSSANTMEPFDFGPIRKHDVEMLHDGAIGHMKWWTASNRTPGASGGNSHDWTSLDAWTDKQVGRGHQLIFTFFGTPTHAARLQSYNDNYNIVGGTSGPVNLVAFKEHVTATINHIVARHGAAALLAVEGWNEALGGGDGTNTADFLNATGYSPVSGCNPRQTLTADIQKAIWDGVQASTHPTVHVIGPSLSYLGADDLDEYFGMKTTGGVSIFSYCSGVAFHPYGMYDSSHSWDATWANFATFTAAVRTRMASAGISSYKLWCTEAGIHAPWNGTSDAWWAGLSLAQKATHLYAWIQSYHDNGWDGLITYASDEDPTEATGFADGYIGSPAVSSQGIRDALSNGYADFGTVTAAASPVGQSAAAWSLVLEDHFEGSLNTALWNTAIWYGDANNSPDTVTNWDHDNGGNSLLRIWPALNGSSQFVQRTLTTRGKFTATYGYFEARIKAPIGRGCFPAFWLFDENDDSVRWREIDIFECYSGGDSGGWADGSLHPQRYGATVHIGTSLYNLNSYGPQKSDYGTDLSAAFHVYGCKWTGTDITFYFDGVQVGSPVTAEHITTPMYILLDLWFGSASGTPNTGETPQGSSNSLEVDYVRVWEAV